MRLVELFLIETTEEDRAIISLSSAIYKYLQKYADQDLDYANPDDEEQEVVRLGKLGNLFDIPIEGMNDINLEIQSDMGLIDRVRRDKPDSSTDTPGADAPGGMWYGDNKTMVLNSDYLSSDDMQSVITHELRHAMDDIKSGYKANASSRYSTARNKSYRNVTKDPHMGNLAYLAQPAEINARFLQVLNKLVGQIPALAKYPQNQFTMRAERLLKRAMEVYNISHLFPEKEKSRDYKRLMKRGMDFIQKELAHVKSNQPK
jgi:hypothetical protein